MRRRIVRRSSPSHCFPFSAPLSRHTLLLLSPAIPSSGFRSTLSFLKGGRGRDQDYLCLLLQKKNPAVFSSLLLLLFVVLFSFPFVVLLLPRPITPVILPPPPPECVLLRVCPDGFIVAIPISAIPPRAFPITTPVVPLHHDGGAIKNLLSLRPRDYSWIADPVDAHE